MDEQAEPAERRLPLQPGHEVVRQPDPLERLELTVSPEFTRVTTVVHLGGGGEEGIGEDVTYTAGDHPPPDTLPLAGSYTLDSFSQHLDGLQLFTQEPQMEAWHDYRR